MSEPEPELELDAGDGPLPELARAPAPRAGAMHERVRDRWWLRPLTALVLLVVATALVVRAQRDVGVVRDETFYMGAGTRYAQWWLDVVHVRSGRLTEKSITATFGGAPGGGTNSEHPPLMKTMFGLSEMTLHRGLGVASTVTAYRFPGALMNAILVVIVFGWIAAVWGYAEGVIAALLVLFLPRAFFHAGLACFDGPIVTLWIATLYAYWRGLRSHGWAIAAGVLWGCALATKHNALFIPFVVAPHFVWFAIRSQRVRWYAAIGRALGQRWTLPVAMIVLGPLVLVAMWPWLWFDTWPHVKTWLAFHREHVHYHYEYLGHDWTHPTGTAEVGWYPWHVPIVTTLLTVPAATLVAAALGAGVGQRDETRRRTAHADTAPGVLLFLSLVVSFAPFLLGIAPIFGAEKHWATAIPSICVAAAIGCVWAARRAAAAVAERWPAAAGERGVAAAIAVVALFVVGAAAIETAHAQPYALSEYNAIAGGAPGGADLGMNRQFWGYAARGVLPFLRTLPPGPVYSHEASLVWGIYLRDGLVPRNLPDAGPEADGVARSTIAIVVHELHFNRHDYMIWDAYGTVQPVYVLRFDGVPIVSVYQRRAR